MSLNLRKLSILAGISYLIIFFCAFFANFYVLDSILESPVSVVQNNSMIVRLGIIAFLFTVVFDVIVAWVLYELYKNHSLSILSTFFRMMHAMIMGVAIYSLPILLKATSEIDILLQVEIFNTIWLIGLFFFGIHIILLTRIITVPRFVNLFLFLAGVMYIIDTFAHFLLPNYTDYETLFLTLVAIPSILGEMSFTIWLLVKGGKT